MAEEALVLAMIEVAKLSLSAYFEAMRVAGKSPEEIDAMFQEQYEMFRERPPSDLIDV